MSAATHTERAMLNSYSERGGHATSNICDTAHKTMQICPTAYLAACGTGTI